MPSVYEIVTEQIIKQLQTGVAPWRKPWRTEIPCNLVSKKPYRGINVFLLGFQGYGSKYWLTFNQAKALGGHVKQGEHGSKCVFWKIDDYSKENKETGELENRTSALVPCRISRRGRRNVERGAASLSLEAGCDGIPTSNDLRLHMQRHGQIGSPIPIALPRS